MSLIPFSKHLHEIRVAWVQLPAAEKKKTEESVSRMDPTAVAKLKMVSREIIRKGIVKEDFFADYHEIVDIWLAEIRSQEPGLEVYKKAAVISYAMNIMR
jgi:hypothetical protein